MAVENRAPWWLSGLLLVGVILIFLGDRALAHTDIAGGLTWLGWRLIPATLIVRGWIIYKSDIRWRRVEILAALCTFGVFVSLVLYYFVTPSGMEMLGLSKESTIARWQLVMTPLWLILLLVSLLPLLFIELSLGISGRGAFKDRGGLALDQAVDVYRVRETATSALSIAFAACFLMVTCNIASQRNIRKDVSYFKTSTPGSATMAIVNTLPEPLRVLLFFPQSNDVGLEVSDYFLALQEQTGKVSVESLDRLVHSVEAKKHEITKDGTVVFVRGEKTEKFSVGTDIAKARKSILRELDATVQKNLLSVISEAKVAYMSVGHGELNDPKSVTGVAQGSLRKVDILRSILKKLNYKVKNYEGFGKVVPDDCALLFVLSPAVAMTESELLAIDDYVARGGAAILSLDPKSEMRLGVLGQRFGLRFNAESVIDDKEFMVQARNVSDHAILLTNQFVSHAAISTLSRGAARSAIVFVQPGSFVDVEFENEQNAVKKTHIIRSMSSSFRDLRDESGRYNFVFDPKAEVRDRFNLVTVVEGAASSAANDEKNSKDMRVILISDAEVLSDGVLKIVPMALNMVVDIIKWTGGEESFAGETNDEKDMAIQHTKSQDTIWFYATILGGPALMLSPGILFRRRRRRRSAV